MAYGDRINPVTDDFSTDPFAGRWDNGYADWNAYTWAGTDYVDAPAPANDKGARRANEGSYPNNQYSLGTLQAAISTAAWAATAVRMQNSTTDESCYVGYIRTGAATSAIYEVSSAFAFVELTSGAQTSPTTGQFFVTECEGTTIRLGTNQSGTDTQSRTTTDATITTGFPGLVAYENTTQYDSWEGGEMGVAGGGGGVSFRLSLLGAGR